MQRGEYVPGQGAPLFELRPPVLTGADWALKRTFDIVVSVLVALSACRVWLLVALAIKLDSRGPVFYLDRRVGVGEREFAMMKFRTMVAGAEAAAGGSSRGGTRPRARSSRSATTRASPASARCCAGSRSTSCRR